MAGGLRDSVRQGTCRSLFISFLRLLLIEMLHFLGQLVLSLDGLEQLVGIARDGVQEMEAERMLLPELKLLLLLSGLCQGTCNYIIFLFLLGFKIRLRILLHLLLVLRDLEGLGHDFVFACLGRLSRQWLRLRLSHRLDSHLVLLMLL